MTSTAKANGEDFIVEIQKEKLEYFKDRLYGLVSDRFLSLPKDRLYRLVSSDLNQRASITSVVRNFKLQHIYLIIILDFKYDEKEEIQKFQRTVQWEDQDGNLFYFCKSVLSQTKVASTGSTTVNRVLPGSDSKYKAPACFSNIFPMI